MYTISLEELNLYVDHFNKLQDAKLEFDVQCGNEAAIHPVTKTHYYEVRLHPHFKNIKDVLGIAKIWNVSKCPVKVQTIADFPGYQNIYRANNAEEVNLSHYKQKDGTVKFYAAAKLDAVLGLNIYLLTKAPVESVVDGHTYRLCAAGGDYYSGKIVYYANEEDAAFNYVDPGRIIVSYSSKNSPNARMFVTDALTLDMNYLIAAFTVFPDGIETIVQNGAFIPSKDCRLALLRLEKKIPAKLMPQYQKLREDIQDDFSKNTCNVMIGKLTRKESPFVDINNIRISPTEAIYKAGNVSIKAKNLAEVVFLKLNPNEEWDIFTLINHYTDNVEEQFKALLLNAAGTGFSVAKSFEFEINTIPIEVSVSTDNTRRSVNGHLINVDELSAVLKRANCYLPDTDSDNKVDFERFLVNVSRHSLKTRDAWANGLPVKTIFLDSDRNKWGHEDATAKHPKLRFIHKDKKGFFLLVNYYDEKDKSKITKTNEYRIGKFAEFLKKVQAVNRTTNMGYDSNFVRTHEGGWAPKDGKLNACGSALSALLDLYATGITAEDKKTLIGSVNYELSEAEKKSEEMLKEACTLTKTKPGERKGKKGYVIPGKLRSYFVEEDTLRVYDADPKGAESYFCVVNKGEQGVGKDALVSRIFALHNDSMMAKHITTLNRA